MMLVPLVVVSTLLSATPSDQSPAPRQIGSRTQTDQTVPVQKGARIDLDDCTGDAIVRTWDRDSVRVRASHSSRTRIRINAVGQVVRIDADADRGAGFADFELTVPVWINLNLSGRGCSVDVEGVGGTVSVETNEGDIVLRGLTGS